MVRDYSAFIPGAAPARRDPTDLELPGRGSAFASQIDADALTETRPSRASRNLRPSRFSMPNSGTLALNSRRIFIRNADAGGWSGLGRIRS